MAEAAPSQPVAASEAKGEKPGEIRSEFEKRVKKAKTRAWWMAVLHVMLRYLGIWALTWATAVLLGGFSSDLSVYDFAFISFILALESIRIFFVETMTDILYRDRFSESSVPHEFKFLDTQQKEVNEMALICQVFSAVLSSVTLVSSSVRLVIRLVCHVNEIFNLLCSLYVFDCLIFVISFAALLHAYMRYSLRRNHDASPQQNSLMYFHDEVYRTAIRVGLGEGDRLEILNFAFTKLASDFRRNIRPQQIQIQNKDLIRYLYHNQQGIAIVCEALKSPSDIWQQVVAANLPGFWVAEARIELQLGLFWELGERMHGAGKDAEGALNSIEHLALSFATNLKMRTQAFHPFLLEDPAIGTGRSCIVSRLVRLVCKRVRPTLLFQIRALEACCQSSQVVQYLRGRRRSKPEMTTSTQVEDAGGDEAELQELYAALKQLLQNNQTKAKIYAVSAWVALLSDGRENLGEGIPTERMESFKQVVLESTHDLREWDKKEKPYFWLNEVLIVERLRKILGMDGRPDWGKGPLCVRSNKDAAKIDKVESKIEEYLVNRFPPKPTCDEIKPFK